MAKPALACPFSNKACTECGIYRGRHHSRGFSGPHQGSVVNPQERLRPVARSFSADFQTLSAAAEPEKHKGGGAESVPRIRLKVIDVEKGESRVCDLREAENWDWKNAVTWRIVDGWQIAGYDRLMHVVRLKAQRGDEEVEIYEAPRFMLLAGG